MTDATLIGGTPARAQQLALALAPAYAARLAARPAASDSVIFWLDPTSRDAPYPAHACNVADLAQLLPPTGPSTQREAWRRSVAQSCVRADLVLTGSDAETGLWTPVLEQAGCTAPVLMFPAVPEAPKAIAGNGLSITIETLPSPALTAALTTVANWAITAGMGLTIGLRGAAGVAGLAALRVLRALPGVTVLHGQAPPAGLVLDLREPTADERLRIPPAIATALAAGCPVLTVVPGVLSQRLSAFGAGQLATLDALPAALDAMAAALPTLRQAASSYQAPTQPDQLLQDAVTSAGTRRAAAVAGWDTPAGGAPPLGPNGHVLVLSNEHELLLDVRVHGPLGELHRRGAIGGYAVVRHGQVVFSTRALGDGISLPFHAIVVHRAHDPALITVMRALDRPFLYDLDDNLLAAPAYRDAFAARTGELVRTMLARAAVISCSTPRLVQLLQAGAGIRLADRAIVTPNLAPAPAIPRPAGRPRALIWASSDTPALTTARDPIEAAVRDFCIAYRIRLVCLGAKPSATLAAAAPEHVGLLPRAAYLDYIRALAPAMLVCPLETGAEPGTQDFVDGKSDIKMLDAAMTGLVGVYSDGGPYRETEMTGGVLCPNTYDGWLDGLERGYRACEAGSPASALPPSRTTAQGLAPYATALSYARLAEPIHLHTVLATHAAIDAHRVRLLDPAEFDDSYYLETHTDVAAAVAKGSMASAYDHYLITGYRERRDARAIPGPDAPVELWWECLQQTIACLQRQTEAREAVITRLRSDHDARRNLRS